MQVTLKGYVNNVRNNTLSSGKEVTNISLACSMGKDRDGKNKYQKVDVAFWNESAKRASEVKEKDYVIIPDVMLTDFEAVDVKGTLYVNVKGMARDIFVSPTITPVAATSNAIKDDVF